MKQLTLDLPDKLFRRLTLRARADTKTPEELAYERLRRELGEDWMDSQTVKEQARAFVRRRAGRCLTVREPVLEEMGDPLWLVPVVTNVPPDEAAYVGQVVVNARTGEILSDEAEIVAMLKKAHPSLGFQEFPLDQQFRLTELMDRNNEGRLTDDERADLQALVEDSLALDIANWEQVEQRLLPDN